jgi:hypothetical protein
MSELVTVDSLKRALPSKKKFITQEAVDIINASRNDPEFQGESLLQTATTYEAVLAKSKVSITEYLNAIKFVAYMTTNDENFTKAYIKVFQHRDFVKERMNKSTSSVEYKELTSAASRYRRSKLVVDILTLAQVPLDLMFTGYRYKAVGILADVMETARLDRDKINAAKELLAATKGPDNMKIELDVGVQENSAVQQLNDQLAEIAARSLTHLQSGSTDLKELGSMKVKEDNIIDGETV